MRCALPRYEGVAAMVDVQSIVLVNLVLFTVRPPLFRYCLVCAHAAAMCQLQSGTCKIAGMQAACGNPQTVMLKTASID
jgi:hypothetical protein